MAQTAVTPALLAVRKAVADNVANIPGLVLVACSGGADSLGLAAGAALVGRPIAAAVIDHGLQEGSAQVAATAAEQCVALGLDPVLTRRVEVRGPGGPEAAARTARYAALRQIATEIEAEAIMLAHTLDDQAETVLLRLARGSGARSLSGMAAVDKDLRRPLLGLRRALVRQACHDAHLHPHEDPHNHDPRHARARVRRHSLPALVEDLGDSVVLGLARSAAGLREDNAALDQWAATVPIHENGAEVADLQPLPHAVVLRVLRRLALAAGCPGSSLTRGQLLDVAALIDAWRGQGPIHLPGGVLAARKSGRLVLVRPGRHSAH